MSMAIPYAFPLAVEDFWTLGWCMDGQTRGWVQVEMAVFWVLGRFQLHCLLFESALGAVWGVMGLVFVL